jgi:hypothetical protein
VPKQSYRKFGDRKRLALRFSVALGLLLLYRLFAQAQEPQQPAPSSPPSAGQSADVRALGEAVRQLQSQVQALTAQLSELRAAQQRTQQGARQLRHELHASAPQEPSQFSAPYNSASDSSAPEASTSLSSTSSPSTATATDTASSDRLAKLEEDVQFTDAKVNEQYQSKVESGSKYRLRLSGIVLLNLFANRGTVDNLDFPNFALEREAVDPAGTFGGTLRQSQLTVQAFGPEIAGSHTSADIDLDFAGGFPSSSYGVSTGLVRLRTGTIHLDWANTSLVAGQDHLFFTPLAPSSLASLATPALSYSGNLWNWTPQVRLEHRLHLSESSTLLFQGGILDSFTGELPGAEYYRTPTAGESSAQPAYATRIALTQRVFGQNLALGFGGYYGRQNWGLNRKVDGWAGTTDLTLPLGHLFEFTGEFYRGRAVGGLGGAFGYSVVMSGPLTDPTTVLQGLNSMGGWAQLKFKPLSKLEFNGAFGQENPFAVQLERFASNPAYYDTLIARNRSGFINFIYQPRSDVLFSAEYRRLRTFTTDGDSHSANLVSLSLGYVF